MQEYLTVFFQQRKGLLGQFIEHMAFFVSLTYEIVLQEVAQGGDIISDSLSGQ